MVSQWGAGSYPDLRAVAGAGHRLFLAPPNTLNGFDGQIIISRSAVFGTSGLGGSPWRVAPAVVEAVQGALAEYNSVRSPLYPLSQIQRLGYRTGELALLIDRVNLTNINIVAIMRPKFPRFQT